MSLKNIYRWVLPDAETATETALVIPGGGVTAEAIEFGPKGVTMRLLSRGPLGAATVFPEIQIWDDPSRSEVLAREEENWELEDMLPWLQEWERVRLEQFLVHCFPSHDDMHVVYRSWPTAEPTRFHNEGVFFQGWRIEMVASIFAGFTPKGMKPFEFHKQEELEPEPKPELTPSGKPKLRLV